MIDLKSQLSAADSLIRAGNAQSAARLLALLRREVALKLWTREEHLLFADLCRRCSLFNLGLRALLPYMGHDQREIPTPKESAAYAGILIKIGSVSEAAELLGKLPRSLPEIDLYSAYACISEWNYAAAVPHLRRYLEWPQLAPYQRSIGEVNLAAAWVALGEASQGQPLLQALLSKAKHSDWKLLLKNSLELSAQLAIESGDYTLASQCLDRIEISEVKAKDDLLVAKQRAVLALKLEHRNARKLITSVRERATSFEHWETVRDCDYQLALAQHDENLVLQVYFGTPYPSYRRRLADSCRSWLGPLPQSWIFGGRERVFDIRQGKELGEALRLKPGQAVHRMFAALSSDLYRPISQGALFARLFSNQYYDPESGLQRIANVLLRWRRWCEETRFPFRASVEKGSYRLEVPATCGLRLWNSTATSELTPAVELTLERLLNFAPKEFSSRDAASVLHLGLRSTIDILNWGVKNGYLLRLGKGPATKYISGLHTKAAAA